MAHMRHLSGTVQALFRVFVQPSVAAVTPRVQSSIRPRISVAPAILNSPSQRRTAIKYRAPVQSRFVCDEKIGSLLINLVDDEGGFHPAERLDHTLQTIDRVTHHVVRMDLPDENSEYPYPVCKVLSKSFLREQEQYKQKLKTRNLMDGQIKTIELHWTAGEHDLGHWLKRMKEFLEEGKRVDVVLGQKKRGRVASMKEAEAVLANVNSVVATIQGAKERKEPEGQVGGIMTLFFQGKKEKEENEKEERGEEDKESGAKNTPKVSRWKIKEEKRQEARREEASREEARREAARREAAGPAEQGNYRRWQSRPGGFSR